MQSLLRTAVLLAIVFIPSLGLAQISADFDPRGLYINQFTGPFTGSEAFQIIPGEAENELFMTDIRGGGFRAIIDANGQLSIQNGAGAFSDDDHFVLFPFDGTFSFTGRRVPHTGSDFPLELSGAPLEGNAGLAGTYRTRTEISDPLTGDVQTTFNEDNVVSVDGSRLRITDPQGLFFQGVFVAENTVAFRDIGSPLSAEFFSFPGSTQNLDQDIVGVLEFGDEDHFTATILTQTRAEIGSEVQRLVRFTASRIDEAQ